MPRLLFLTQERSARCQPPLKYNMRLLRPCNLLSHEVAFDSSPFLTHETPVDAYPNRRTMVADSPSVFRPFLQEFFVKASDPLFTCTLKLDVLTALVTKDNCATILGELQTYVLHRDKSFVCAAVRAVGRVAHARPEAADQCLHVRVVVLTCKCFGWDIASAS